MLPDQPGKNFVNEDTAITVASVARVDKQKYAREWICQERWLTYFEFQRSLINFSCGYLSIPTTTAYQYEYTSAATLYGRLILIIITVLARSQRASR